MSEHGRKETMRADKKASAVERDIYICINTPSILY